MLRTPSQTRPASLEDLLDTKLLARLDAMDISSRKVFRGKLKGERRSKKRGESVEFADHRPYVRGDDLRHIDWNIYGRLDRLFMKLFLEEEDLSLHLVIDSSASMECGTPDKFNFIQRAAAALAYVGLVNYNRVTMTAMGEHAPDEHGEARDSGGILSTLRNLRGRRRVREMGDWLCKLEPYGAGNFTDAARRIALTRQGKGVMVILSDFFYKEGYEKGLRYLVGRGYDLVVIQVLSPQEVEPDIGGDLRLRDVEDGDAAEVTISGPLLKRYKANLAAYCNQLHEFCVRREITFITVQSDVAMDALLLDYLRARGVLR